MWVDFLVFLEAGQAALAAIAGHLEASDRASIIRPAAVDADDAGAQAAGHALDPATTHVYLCGNPKMIGVPVKDKETGERKYPEPTGVIEVLERRGFHADNAATKFKGNIHFEEYW